jgi:hypothetical protein
MEMPRPLLLLLLLVVVEAELMVLALHLIVWVVTALMAAVEIATAQLLEQAERPY